MGEALDTLKPGVVRTVIVAWHADDPALQDDGRFWMKVPAQGESVFGKPPGTIFPKGQPLSSWRARFGGDEVEVPNPTTGGRERFSLARWSADDPDLTRVMLLWEHLFDEPVECSADEAARIRRAKDEKPGTTHFDMEAELSNEAKRFKREQAELQRQYREARDRDDEQRMRELSVALKTTSDELMRAGFPHYCRGWDLSFAIREATDRFILDWTTGY